MKRIATYLITLLFALFTIGVHAEWHMCLSEDNCHEQSSESHDCCSDDAEDQHDTNSCCADTSIDYYAKDASFLPTQAKHIPLFPAIFGRLIAIQNIQRESVQKSIIDEPFSYPSYPPPYIAFCNFKVDISI
ncbi:MAG: hypothetical protein H6606_08645 [Flavobacteriales bacterium]|nr:hypothetical protein [Flavobacteriales bacterium]